ncbi:hypothetical protein Tco_0807228 [Tanacetum coccineum]
MVKDNPSVWSRKLDEALWAFCTAYKTPSLRKQFLQMHELEELRLRAYENFKLYKSQTKAYHDRKLRIQKEFNARYKVLLYNSKYNYVELYEKQGGSFIVNGHRAKLYHDEEQLNERLNYRKTMPLVAEKPFIYSVVENICNKAKLYDLDKTGEGIVKGNFLYVKKEPSEESPHRKK